MLAGPPGCVSLIVEALRDPAPWVKGHMLYHDIHSAMFSVLVSYKLTITADIERRIQALEMRCFRKLFSILYRDHITNEEVKARIRNTIGPYEDLTSVKRCKLKWYVTRSSGLAKHYPTGNSSRREMKRQTEEMMGRQHQRVD